MSTEKGFPPACKGLTRDFFEDLYKKPGMDLVSMVRAAAEDGRGCARERFARNFLGDHDFSSLDPRECVRAVKGVGTMSPDVRDVLGALGNAIAGVDALCRDDGVVQAFSTQVGHDDPSIRSWAAGVLGEIGKKRDDARVADALFVALSSERADLVARDIVRAILEAGASRDDTRIVEQLLALLAAECGGLATAAAVRALAQLVAGEQLERATDAVLKTLDQPHRDAEVVQAALDTLAKWGEGRPDERILRAALDALDDDDQRVARAGAEALQRLVRADTRQLIADALFQRLLREEKPYGAGLMARALREVIAGDAPLRERLSHVPSKQPPSGLGSACAEPDWKRLLQEFRSLAVRKQLVYHDAEVQRYHAALWAHPDGTRHFVILAGVSGTGKTRLATTYAEAVASLHGYTQQRQFIAVVAVRPEWTDARDLLGYYNPILNRFLPTPVLEFVQQAGRDRGRPYFLILDEMNIAHVEYYFSDFLSAMESGQPIRLHNPRREESSGDHQPTTPDELELPPNLFVTGTINMDETTQEISPKVLDRATLLVLKPDWSLYHQTSALGKDLRLGQHFRQLLAEDGMIRKVAELLDGVGLGFGYRTAEDMVRYLAKAVACGRDAAQAVDEAVCTKILPKIRGVESENMRSALEGLQNLLERSGAAEAAGRVSTMLKDLGPHGFVKFRAI